MIQIRNRDLSSLMDKINRDSSTSDIFDISAQVKAN